MTGQAVNLAEKFMHFSDHWAPRTVARMNDTLFKLVKIQGEFVWHSHPETDELFMVIKGQMKILFRSGEVALKEGDLYVVQRGVEHKPVADRECEIMLVEPASTVNTGDAGGDKTQEVDVWI